MDTRTKNTIRAFLFTYNKHLIFHDSYDRNTAVIFKRIHGYRKHSDSTVKQTVKYCRLFTFYKFKHIDHHTEGDILLMPQKYHINKLNSGNHLKTPVFMFFEQQKGSGPPGPQPLQPEMNLFGVF